MQKKIHLQTHLPLPTSSFGLKIVAEYQSRYERISQVLDANYKLVSAVHQDLERFVSNQGRSSTYSSEQYLRVILVKCIEGLSLRDTIILVAQSPFLRNFTRIWDGPVMNYTMLDMAFKRIQPLTWEQLNVILLKYAVQKKKVTGEKLRVDSTVCEANIHYPTDASLLWDCFRVGARSIREAIAMNAALDMGNRFHTKKVKRLYTFVATHSSKKTASTRRAVQRNQKVLKDRVEWLIGVAQKFVAHGRTVSSCDYMDDLRLNAIEAMLPKFTHVVLQASRAQSGETVPAAERIFSIFEEHAELLKRGKAHKPVEFGHLVTLGQTKEKFISFYKVEQVSRHDKVLGDEALQEHKNLFGAYPKHFTADKNYYGGPEHLEKWEKKIEMYAVGKKGNRNEQETEREHSSLFRLLQRFRAGCEGSISVLKRSFGLLRCLFRGFEGFASSIGCTVFCHNLCVLSRMRW